MEREWEGNKKGNTVFLRASASHTGIFFSFNYGFELHTQKKYKAKIKKYVMNECFSLSIDCV